MGTEVRHLAKIYAAIDIVMYMTYFRKLTNPYTRSVCVDGIKTPLRKHKGFV